MAPPKEQGRVLNASSASHSQVVYAAIETNSEARGINGPMFTRQVRLRLSAAQRGTRSGHVF